MTVHSTMARTHAPAADVSTARLFARTCAAEWTRLWTVRGTWLFLLAAAVVMLGLGTALGFEAAADPVEIQGGPAWETAQFIAMPAQFALLALALTAATSDYATGGIIPTLQWTPRRSILFLARTVVTIGTATAIGVLLAIGAALASFTTARSALALPVDAGLDMLATVAFVFAAGTALSLGLGLSPPQHRRSTHLGVPPGVGAPAAAARIRRVDDDRRKALTRFRSDLPPAWRTQGTNDRDVVGDGDAGVGRWHPPARLAPTAARRRESVTDRVAEPGATMCG